MVTAAAGSAGLVAASTCTLLLEDDDRLVLEMLHETAQRPRCSQAVRGPIAHP